MAKSPTPKSYEQILGEMLSSYMTRIGVNDLNTGGAMVSFFEAVAQAIYRASGDTFAILRDFSVDRAEGEALKRIAKEENITLIPSRVATGLVTITDSSFSKISTKVYAGSASPNIGSTVISVSDASLFPATGSIYIGRGTPNIEGPIAYSSITSVGGFYNINLSTPTTKYHNINESVVLSQGGVRNIPSGSAMRTDSSGSDSPIVFTTTRLATILDGENEIINVPVAAQETGTNGNIPKNSIKAFVTPPFSGATVSNPSPYTTGRNEQTDEEISIAIKKARISRGLGTSLAIKNAVQGTQAPDENATVTSNEIFSDGVQTTLFIDNGEGYEEVVEGVGLEFIVDSALGGEQYFQLSTGGSQTSLAKAFLESSETSPFDINPTDRLAILVGGILSEHIFSEGDFRSNRYATAFEVVASINANALLSFEARTALNGTKVRISAKEESNEFLQVTDPTTGTDASVALGLSAREIETLKIYKNNQPLSRNGRSAIIESENQTDWINTITSGDTLILAADRTNPITYTFTNADFAAEGTHQTVSISNTLNSWINVINSKIVGVTATINGNRIVLASNLGANSRAHLEIDAASTLVTKGMFSTAQGLVSSGLESDFTLSRNTAQLKLTTPLSVGDSLTAGSDKTQGFVMSDAILGGSVALSADAKLWFLIDNNDAALISHGVVSDSLVDFSKQGGNIVRLKSNLANAFLNVQVGDYVIIWTEELLPGNRLEGRVYSVGTQTNPYDFIEMKITSTEYAAAVGQAGVTFTEGLAFVRSAVPPQKIQITLGSYNINTIAANIESQLIGVEATTQDDEYITLTTTNKVSGGSILIVTFNDPAKNLNFTAGDSGSSFFSHFGLSQSNINGMGMPALIHSYMSQDRSADPPNSFIADFESAIDLLALGLDPNLIMCMQHPYLTSGSYIEDHQSVDECVQIDDILGTNIDIDTTKTIRRVRINDRYYLLNPLNFDYNDDITVVLDADASGKTFPINLYRRAITNTTMSINSDQFRAYDVDAGSTTEFQQFFGTAYDFKNYKALMKARNVIDPNNALDEDAILYRSSEWGKAGNLYRVGYFYPTAANQGIASSVVVDEYVNISILLKSGDPVPNTIDGTTEWDITITPNTPIAGVDEVTYTHNGTGTVPGMGTLAPGHYVTINSSGEFNSANIGSFRVVSATSTSFTIYRPNGVAVAQTGVATLTTNTIFLYENDDTTAAEIVTYVNDNLTDWIAAELIDDNGSTGAGIISLSTYEDNDYVANTQYVLLVDGINWIASSDLDAIAPNFQFEFKRTLSLPSYNTNTIGAYAFNNGEEVRIIPTTIKQVQEFLSVLAVTGITTIGEVATTDRNALLQFASSVLGSDGAVTISGGNGNLAQAQIVNTGSTIVNSDVLMKVGIQRSASGGINVGSWLRLEATNAQNKITGISFTTQVTITPNQPTANESIIALSNRDISDRYFGVPRNHFRDRGRVFHVEKHGSLVNISWNGSTGGDPIFSKIVNINDGAGGSVSVSFNSDFNTTEFTITAGVVNFNEVQLEDTVVIQNFADAANNGTFKVAGVSDDGLTLSVTNENGVSAAAAAFASGDFVITTTIAEGDTVEIGSPFSNLNQGTFRVVRRYANSIYIENNSAVEERVLISDNLRGLGFDGTTQFDITVPGNMRIEWNTNGTEPTLENAIMGDVVTVGTSFAAANQGTFMVVDSGDNFIELANANAVVESGILVSGVGGNVLEAQIPSMIFSPYENTNIGDIFAISGNVLSANNQGTYNITKVLSKSRIVVDDILQTQTSIQLNTLFTQVSVLEDVPYIGYKQVYSKAVDPANTQRITLLFNSQDQVQKITEAGSILMTAMSKLGFEEDTTTGFDSYKYHTGLIRQANKVVYGDPRDNVTYPGVSAAGAEIFIKPPLVRRIQVSINVRVNTGIPFARITEQVRNNIAALVNSTAIGTSIAISDLISSVNSIPGTRAISISFPEFTPQNDLIVINPSEKPLILDVVNDITVSKIE